MRANHKRLYYKDPANSTYRIVQQITPSAFVVVKVFEGRTRTVKFWRGDLSETATHWRTKLFDPSPQAKRLLDTEFEVTLQEFGPMFNLALSL